LDNEDKMRNLTYDDKINCERFYPESVRLSPDYVFCQLIG
jgi:hypothetical protein